MIVCSFVYVCGFVFLFVNWVFVFFVALGRSTSFIERDLKEVKARS